MNKPKLTINITDNDTCLCECGSESFVPVYGIAKIKVAIGEPYTAIPTREPIAYICSACGTKLDIDRCDTKGSISKEE